METHLADYGAATGSLCGADGRAMSHHEIKRGRITCRECLARYGARERVWERMQEITTRTEGGGWRVETHTGPVLFPPEAGRVAAATARIEAERS